MEQLSPQEIDALQELNAFIKKDDYYELFGISYDFSSQDLRKAYYDLSRQYHPDRFFRRNIEGHEDLVEAVFIGINKGYNTFKNSTARRRYDNNLRRRTGKGPTYKAKKARSSTPLTEGMSADSGVGAGGLEDDVFDESTSDIVVEQVGRRKGANPAPRGAAPGKDRSGRQESVLSPHIDRLRHQIAQRLAKGRRYYKTAQEDLKQERWVKAAGALYLAMQYDPRNEEYKRLHAEVSHRANQLRVAHFVSVAENAESYRNIREALANYQRAAEYEPEDGLVYFRLAELLMSYEDDARGALKHYRSAVEKEPQNVKYRLSLAALYMQLELTHNAKREFQAVLKLDPKNSEAKAGIRKVR